MTGRPPTVHDSRLASIIKQSESGEDGGSRLLAGGGLGVVLLSVALSSVAYGMLPEQVRIHWTLGMGPYYGPEFAPTLAVLAGFPVLIAGTALGAYWLDTRIRHATEVAGIRPYYLAALLGTLGVLLASQGALIVANM